MRKRDMIMKFAKRERLQQNTMNVFVICKGERKLEETKEIDAPMNISISIHCTDKKQLKIQNKTMEL